MGSGLDTQAAGEAASTLVPNRSESLHWLGSLAQGEHVFVTVAGEGGFELTNSVGYSCFSVTNVD